MAHEQLVLIDCEPNRCGVKFRAVKLGSRTERWYTCNLPRDHEGDCSNRKDGKVQVRNNDRERCVAVFGLSGNCGCEKIAGMMRCKAKEYKLS